MNIKTFSLLLLISVNTTIFSMDVDNEDKQLLSETLDELASEEYSQASEAVSESSEHEIPYIFDESDELDELKPTLPNIEPEQTKPVKIQFKLEIPQREQNNPIPIQETDELELPATQKDPNNDIKSKLKISKQSAPKNNPGFISRNKGIIFIAAAVTVAITTILNRDFIKSKIQQLYKKSPKTR